MPRCCQGNCTMGGEDDAPAPPAAANARARDQSRWCIEICCGCRQRCRQDPRSETHLPAQRTPVDRRRPRQVRPVGTDRQRSGARPVAEGAVPAGLPPIPSLGDGEAMKVHRAISPAGTPRARRAAPGRSGDRCRPAQVWFRPLRSRFVADDPHRQQLLTPSWSTSNPSREHRRPDSDRTWGTYLNGLAMTWRRVGKTCAGKICLSNRCSLAILATTEIRSSAVAPMPFGQPLRLLVPLLTLPKGELHCGDHQPARLSKPWGSCRRKRGQY
jgi:hypothetical protein